MTPQQEAEMGRQMLAMTRGEGHRKSLPRVSTPPALCPTASRLVEIVQTPMKPSEVSRILADRYGVKMHQQQVRDRLSRLEVSGKIKKLACEKNPRITLWVASE